MEKNQKNKIQDLLERAITLAELAGKCYMLGLIRDFHVDVEIDSDDAYFVRVAVDEYINTEKLWCDTTRVCDSRTRERGVDFESMVNHLQGMLDERKQAILAELEIMEG